MPITEFCALGNSKDGQLPRSDRFTTNPAPPLRGEGDRLIFTELHYNYNRCSGAAPAGGDAAAKRTWWARAATTAGTPCTYGQFPLNNAGLRALREARIFLALRSRVEG